MRFECAILFCVLHVTSLAAQAHEPQDIGTRVSTAETRERLLQTLEGLPPEVIPAELKESQIPSRVWVIEAPEEASKFFALFDLPPAPTEPLPTRIKVVRCISVIAVPASIVSATLGLFGVLPPEPAVGLTIMTGVPGAMSTGWWLTSGWETNEPEQLSPVDRHRSLWKDGVAAHYASTIVSSEGMNARVLTVRSESGEKLSVVAIEAKP